jgi:hypothetical protein
MRIRTSRAALVAIVAIAIVVPSRTAAQTSAESEASVSRLESEYPDLFTLLIRLEHAHGILYGGLFAEGEEVRATAGALPTPNFEFDMLNRLTSIMDADGDARELAVESAAGYAVLGERAAEVLRVGNAFEREVMSIYADPAISDRPSALDEAVQRYLGRPETALPADPKDMTILYDHPYAWALRTGYADLSGLVWAGHWFRLAATEPLMTLDGREERLAGLDTVALRFRQKLTYGEPPAAFPTELPLTPPIAPGLAWAHTPAAIIIDNLNMLKDVLADILVAPNVPSVPGAIDVAVTQFLDPTYRIVNRESWMTMALRHSIFNQGGPALGVMTQTDRVTSGHSQHFQTGMGILAPGM